MKFIYKAKSGHKYFEDDQKRLHVADDSGDTPLVTEDGDLIVDPTRSIAVNLDSPWDTFTIPLVTPKGEASSTLGNVHEALFLQKRGLRLDQEARNLVERYQDSLSLDF
ncbi:MAG TPA: hypothetical protein V6C57_16800 [Coleofasciculaceae cyanobacterium]